MPIFRMQRNTDNFTIITNKVINDKRLSFKARGLLIYLLSKPQHWQVSSKQLAGASPQGITAIRSAMKELVTCGYARLQTVQGEDGRLSGRFWSISDLPIPEDGTDCQVF